MTFNSPIIELLEKPFSSRTMNNFNSGKGV